MQRAFISSHEYNGVCFLLDRSSVYLLLDRLNVTLIVVFFKEGVCLKIKFFYLVVRSSDLLIHSALHAQAFGLFHVLQLTSPQGFRHIWFERTC